MKCNRCGVENVSGAKFCENCGNKLNTPADNQGPSYFGVDDDFFSDVDKTLGQTDPPEFMASNHSNQEVHYGRGAERQEPILGGQNYEDNRRGGPVGSYGEKKNIMIIVTTIIVAILVSTIGFIYLRKGPTNKEEKALAYMEEGNYEAAAAEYQKLYEDSSDKIFLDKKDQAEKEKVDQNHVKLGIKEYEKDDYPSAMDHFLLVSDNSKSYTEAKNYMDLIYTHVIDEIKSFYEREEYEAAYDLASQYSFSFSNEKDLLRLREESRDKITEKKEKELAEREAQLESDRRAIKETQEAASKTLDKLDKAKKEGTSSNSRRHDEYYNYAYSYLETNQSVKSEVANIRTGPGLNYPESGKLYKGEVVFISEIRVDPSYKRFWCNIGDGWISSKILDIYIY